MSRGAFGVDALVEEHLEIEHPFCEHGPTLLFERFTAGKTSRKYFACSACRDRKECDFFQWADEKPTKGKLLKQKEIKKMSYKKNLTKRELQESDNWCITCEVVIHPRTVKQHEDHPTKVLSLCDIVSPSHLLTPKDNKKFNAQYFFDDDTTNFLTTTITRLGYKKVICIGAPRLFEEIKKKNDVSTFLLDIDKRLLQFYSPECFLQYNMFNNFFFNKNGEETFRKYMSDSNAMETLIVVDPPFGGLINVLSKTLRLLWNMGDQVTLATMLIFPYFLESHVMKNLEDFTMLDYKVSYANHPHYSTRNTRGSAVRIFTNIPPDRVSLPKEGYRFCKLCQRYVYKENRHCKLCKLCTSKDGRTYVHCDECNKCVKPGRVHCKTCESCQVDNHKCGREKVGCHVCGAMDHKRRECPDKKTNTGLLLNGKRPMPEVTKSDSIIKKKRTRINPVV